MASRTMHHARLPSRFRRPFVALVLLVPIVGCAGATDAPPPDEVENTSPDCTQVTPPTFASLEAGTFSHCVGCHSSTLTGAARSGSPDRVNFDDYADAKAASQLAYVEVKRRAMPYPNGEGITNAERNRLYEWVLCGTPP